ncbi:DUF1963 domain-containing protein [bacterium]|nr:MAG: DUF1963 domain-containing protein [bacterium]
MLGLFKKKSPAEPRPKPTLAEVEAKYADQIRELVQVAATLEEADVSTRSRFGGGPVYFPPDTAWPQHKGKPLLLLIQIDLAEAVAAVPELLARFPASGMIQVFIERRVRVVQHPLGGRGRTDSGFPPCRPRTPHGIGAGHSCAGNRDSVHTSENTSRFLLYGRPIWG